MTQRILIVDDEPNICISLEVRLKQAGYLTDIAETGQEALDLYKRSLKEKPYDLILLDIIMSGLSGLDVLEEIRKDEASRGIKFDKRIPVVMLTALKDSWKRDSEREGCDGYIVKPFKAEELLAAIKKYIKKS